jgi:hypothetical protein
MIFHKEEMFHEITYNIFSEHFPSLYFLEEKIDVSADSVAYFAPLFCPKMKQRNIATEFSKLIVEI